MLRRGSDPPDDTGIPPEGLDIPNVENREVQRPSGRKIANTIAEFFDNVAVPNVDASVSESDDKIWTGVAPNTSDYDNCENWSDEGTGVPTGLISGVIGELNRTHSNRIGRGIFTCTLNYRLLCASY